MNSNKGRHLTWNFPKYLKTPVPVEQLYAGQREEQDPPEPEDEEIVLVEQVVGQQADVVGVVSCSGSTWNRQFDNLD